jgi:Velvet factor
MHPNTGSAALASPNSTAPNTSTSYSHQQSYMPVDENQYYQNGYPNYGAHGNNPNYPPGYHPPGGFPGPSSMHHPYPPPDDFAGSSAQTSGQFTRNLIGSLTASAFRLKDHRSVPGIWFILQDLSVRTEGTFKLRFSFFNLGQYVSYAYNL